MTRGFPPETKKKRNPANRNLPVETERKEGTFCSKTGIFDGCSKTGKTGIQERASESSRVDKE